MINSSVVFYSIPKYSGKYKISKDGIVLSCNYRRTGVSKILCQYIDKDGYAIVSLMLNKKVIVEKVHRLVATVFIDKQDGLNEVNHINGIKNDNRVENLEWTDRSGNMIHALKTGLRAMTTQKQRDAVIRTNKSKIKKVYQYTIDNVFVKEYNGLEDASCGDKNAIGNISKCCLGKVNKCKGYIWSYIKK